MASLKLDRTLSAWLVFGLAFGALAGAWSFQAAGYAPCELCLAQRWPYDIGVPLAAFVALLANRAPQVWVRSGLALLAVIFLGSMVFGIYHTGVEAHIWEGPTACTGSATTAANMKDFLKQLQHVDVVRCDVVSLHVLGLSLATWNALISALIAALAARAALMSDAP